MTTTQQAVAPVLEVCKMFTFEAAHELYYHNGKCRNPHGHSYKVIVCYKGPIQAKEEEYSESGMVIDFSILSSVWKRIEHNFDHCNLNTWIAYPTAENIALIIKDMFSQMVDHPSAKLSKVQVYETATSYVEILGD